MSLLSLIVLIAVAAVILWGLSQLPLDATLLKIIRMLVIVVIAIAVIYFLAGMLGADVPQMRLR